MTELEVALLLTTISAVLGPILVVKYKHYLANKEKKEDPVVSSIKTTSLINDQLETLQQELDADRVWISQFHNGGNFYPTGKSIQKFSIFYEHTKPGIPVIREIFKQIPVSLFTKPLTTLYEEGEIIIPNYKVSENYGLEAFTEGSKSKSTYIYALNSVDNQFIGTLGIEYTKRVKNLSQDQLDEAKSKSISIGTLLSTYLYQTNKK